MAQKECLLLAGITAEESRQICLKCPAQPCVLDKGKQYKCHHCGGALYYDELDEEFHCLNCARSPIALVKAAPDIEASAKTQTIGTPATLQKRELVPAPVEARKHPFGHYNPLSSFSTNGHWYAPGSIRLSRAQALFLIRNLGMLSEGQYPPEPREYKTEIFDEEAKKHVEVSKSRSSHARTGRRRLNKRAYFETPAVITAELTTRMRHCGIDGMILLLLCTFDSEDKSWIGREIASLMRTDVVTVNKQAGRALNYISGKWPKERKYKQLGQSSEPPAQPAPPSKTSNSFLGLLKRTLVKF